MIVRDALLAWLHYLSIFLLVSTIVGELFLLRKTMPLEIVDRLAGVDRWYGISAGIVIVTGLLRLTLGIKGADFYTHNHVFWTKMALFVLVALLSILPTISFLKWRKRDMPGGILVLADGEFGRIKNYVWAEALLLLFIPLCAAFMARGL